MAYTSSEFRYRTSQEVPAASSRSANISINKLNRRLESAPEFWTNMMYAVGQLMKTYADLYEVPLALNFTENGGSKAYWVPDDAGAYWIDIDLTSIVHKFHNGFGEYATVRPMLNRVFPGWHKLRGFEAVALMCIHEFAHTLTYVDLRGKKHNYVGGHGPIFQARYEALLEVSKPAFKAMANTDILDAKNTLDLV